MPYYAHLKTAEPTTGRAYSSAKEAAEDPAFRPAEEKITFVADPAESQAWRDREEERFSDGTYLPVPWADMIPTTADPRYLHFAHLSLKQPGLIAYTKSEEHGIQDRQTAVRPGKYLQEFFSGQFSDETIARYIGQCGAVSSQLVISDDPDTIERVYTSGSSRPNSCMSKGSSHYRSDCHPVRVYGKPGDLAIAYYGDLENGVNARAIVWPENKIFSRIYGNAEVLRALLKAEGYSSGSLEGARVRAIEGSRGYVMPYVDGINYAELDGRFFVLGSGDYSTSNTDGVTFEGCEDEDEDPDTFYCDGCNDECSNDDYHADGLCRACWRDRHFECDDCHEYCDRADRNVLDNGDELCDDCYDNARQTCENEACDETWIERDLSQASQRERATNHTTDYCEDCAQHYCPDCERVHAYDEDEDETIKIRDRIRRQPFYCAEDLNGGRIGIYPADLEIPQSTSYSPVCPSCGHALRCDATIELPFDLEIPCTNLEDETAIATV
jgi:hypothetical protein